VPAPVVIVTSSAIKDHMTQAEFTRIVKTFDEGEPMRAALYYRARALIDAGFCVEAHILILSTWNFARFRYSMQSFDLSAYEATIVRLADRLSEFGDADLMSIDIHKGRLAIVAAFDELSRIRGIEFTGAAKVLHLMKPRFFVMWDRAITGNTTPRRDYASLDVVTSKFWRNRAFELSGSGYHEFLGYCQERFRGYASPDSRKTLAKCIDEFNFCTITMPLALKRQQQSHE
jgi:hypothetical protein